MLLGIDIQGSDGPSGVLVDKVLGGNDVAVHDIDHPPVHLSVCAELLQQPSESNKIIVAMLPVEFLFIC